MLRNPRHDPPSTNHGEDLNAAPSDRKPPSQSAVPPPQHRESISRNPYDRRPVGVTGVTDSEAYRPVTPCLPFGPTQNVRSPFQYPLSPLSHPPRDMGRTKEKNRRVDCRRRS